ncbi:MAG: hypothetical protein E5V51_25520, partial [Mesorhizobium sp.]
MRHQLLAGACGVALLLAPTAFAQTQTQTPAAEQAPAAEKPATGQDTGTNAADASDDDKQAPIPFEGGQLTITQPEQ